jgi:hypothetical protein
MLHDGYDMWVVFAKILSSHARTYSIEEKS